METLDETNKQKLAELNNEKVNEIIKHYVELCKPAKVTILTDSPEDQQYIRDLALKNGEEKTLSTEGHTVHFDNYNDQARDKAHTWVLLPKGKTLSKQVKTIDYDDGLAEANELLSGIMEGKEMLVGFYCLGPNNSKFSMPAFQITDSSSVIHQQNILYRNGYNEFKNLNGSPEFFHVVHSAGELNEDNTTKNIDKRRVFIDLENERVLSMNNQYGGSSIGLKKLSLRLSISKANKEDWLCEHMFIMGIHPLDKERTTYFTGAFPSMCGKTSTAMVSGQTIVGDDIAFLKKDESGNCIAANVEKGVFGVIKDICPADDPVIYKSITSPREVVFNNVLIKDNQPFWLGMGSPLPEEGTNHSGSWTKGKQDQDGNEIDPSHKNSRFTLAINELENADPKADSPEGVPVSGIIYGGRDSSTSVPVLQSLNWGHGVFIGAAIESETTAATLGAEGEVKHSPMSNMDFLVIPLSLYIKNHLKFGNDLTKVPSIFSTNYFLKENGNFLNDKTDKKVWLLWMDGRVNREFEAIETPVGFIPKYEDIKDLFQKTFNKEYTEEDYNKQFSIRISQYLEKLDRTDSIFNEEADLPEEFKNNLTEQRTRLTQAKEKFGKDVVLPSEF